MDVVGMSVTALGVIRDDDVWAQLPNDGDQRSHRFARISVDEPLPVSRWCAVHAGVTPSAGAAEEDRLLETERVQCGGQLTDAVATQLIGVVDGELRPALADHFPLFSERACDNADLRTTSGVVRDRRARRQRL